MTETLLFMSPNGVPLYSARGLSQNLTPSPEAKPPPRRTVNGTARFLGLSTMKKYDSTITCTDQQAPAFGGLWPGDEILVNCVTEIGYKTATGSAERTVVPGTTPRVSGDFTYYFPQISFVVLDFDEAADEYKHDYIWRLMLREK